MTFEDPSGAWLSPISEELEPFSCQGEASLFFEPGPADPAPCIVLTDPWIETDPVFVEVGCFGFPDADLGGGDPEKVGPDEDPLTGDPVSEDEPTAQTYDAFCAWNIAVDPVPDALGEVIEFTDDQQIADPEELLSDAAVDPLPSSLDSSGVDEPYWRGGDAPLPYWRGSFETGESQDAPSEESDQEPVLYALDQLIESTDDSLLDPAIQVCYFSLGAPSPGPSEASSSADQSVAPAVASPVRSTQDLPPEWTTAVAAPLPVVAAQGVSAEAVTAPAEPTDADPVIRLLALTEDSSTGVDVTPDWRELIRHS